MNNLTESDMHRLYGLLSDRAESKSEIELEKQRLASIETEISILIAPLNKAIKIPGIGSVVLSKPSVSTAFDADALREFIKCEREVGNYELADAIERCTKRVERSGGLRVTVDKH